MDASTYGTLYQTLQRTTGKHGNRPAYAVPPMAKRAYHPGGWEVTFEQTLAAVEEMKRAYQRAGYGYGHRVAILFDQRPEFFFHYYALNALGASIVPVNPDYRVDEIRYVVEHSEANLAIAIESRLADMQAATQDIAARPPVVAFERSFENLPSAQRPPQSAKPGFDTEAALLYTSGTTGRPKGCILTNEYFHSFGACYLSLGGRLDFREGQERLYNPLPLHHANCLSVSSSALLLCGGCLIFPDRFHASTWWKDLIATRATAAQFQGIIPNILLKLPPCREERQHSVRFSLCAGIEPSQHEVFEQRYGFPVVEMWAMTETGRLISDSVEPRAVHTRSFGRPNAWVEVRIVDEQQPRRGAERARRNGDSPQRGASAQRILLRLSEELRSHRGSMAQRLVPHRRRGGARRERHAVLRGPQEEHHPPLGGEHRRGGDRGLPHRSR